MRHARVVASLLAATTTFVSLTGPGTGGFGTGNLGTGAALAAGRATATRVAVTADAARTTFTLDLSVGVEARVFTLADPYRVVVELPDVAFALPKGAGEKPTGLVSAFRFGGFEAGRSRIVLDTSGPVAVRTAEMLPIGAGPGAVARPGAGAGTGPGAGAGPGAGSGSAARLKLVLERIDPVAFGAGTGGPQGDPTGGSNAAAAAPPADGLRGTTTAPYEPPPRRGKPVVVVDPGHGGVDPGAIGAANNTEKSIVLAVGLAVKRALEASGRYQVVMTRTTDAFLSLERRVAISEEANADLFVSLHADSLENTTLAYTTQGASIYVLSDKASDEQARKMAEKENSADLVAGIGQRSSEASDEVRGILTDLWARETSEFSQMASRSLTGSLGKIAALGRKPERSGAFRVLKQPRTPAVLIELGFLSNPTEEQRLTSPAWQKQVAASIATAIDTYFRKRSSRAGGPLAPGGGQPP
jgi:N-acetylmuramoyl-L-alanine amidase